MGSTLYVTVIRIVSFTQSQQYMFLTPQVFTCCDVPFEHRPNVTVMLKDTKRISVKMKRQAAGQDLLEALKGKLTSSSTSIWAVDSCGCVNIVKSSESLTPYFEQDIYHFYALEPSHMVCMLI